MCTTIHVIKKYPSSVATAKTTIYDSVDTVIDDRVFDDIVTIEDCLISVGINFDADTSDYYDCEQSDYHVIEDDVVCFTFGGKFSRQAYCKARDELCARGFYVPYA